VPEEEQQQSGDLSYESSRGGGGATEGARGGEGPEGWQWVSGISLRHKTLTSSCGPSVLETQKP
jgi:hypothetical protein